MEDLSRHKRVIKSILDTFDAAERVQQEASDLQRRKPQLEAEIKALQGQADEARRRHGETLAALEEETAKARDGLAAVKGELADLRETKRTEMDSLSAQVAQIKAELDSLTAVRNALRDQLHSVAGVES